MKLSLLDNKSRVSLEYLAYKRLILKRPLNKVIPFSDVYEIVCPIFCLKKKECRLLLKSMRNYGLISISSNHGIRLKEVEIEYENFTSYQ